MLKEKLDKLKKMHGNDIPRIREILAKDAGADVIAKLTDEEISQFDDILWTVAEILHKKSKHGVD